LVATDEDAEDPVSEQDTGGEWRPDADVAVGCPAHPEETDWNGDGTTCILREVSIGKCCDDEYILSE